jgi:hypothetical protein
MLITVEAVVSLKSVVTHLFVTFVPQKMRSSGFEPEQAGRSLRSRCVL